MPPTGNTEAGPQTVRPLSGWTRTGAAAALCLFLAACASTDSKQKVVLTGNTLQDGPAAISSGPPRDRVLWQYRTAAALMRSGDFQKAKPYLDDAITTLGGIYGDSSGRKARGYFSAEAKKTFIG